MNQQTPSIADLHEQIADALALARCRETNTKADHPVMGYWAFDEAQRSHLRAQQAGATEAVLAVIAAHDREVAAKALREAAEDLRTRAQKVTDHSLRHHRDGLETACAMLDYADRIEAGE